MWAASPIASDMYQGAPILGPLLRLPTTIGGAYGNDLITLIKVILVLN
jgi:hypothetical protein